MASTWSDIKLRIGWTTKKDVYIIISYTLLALLLAAIINDFVCVFVTEQSPKSTQKFTMALLVSFGKLLF